jgi:hypothetical protein
MGVEPVPGIAALIHNDLECHVLALRAAKLWPERADVDAWFQQMPSPAVVSASDEKQTRL